MISIRTRQGISTSFLLVLMLILANFTTAAIVFKSSRNGLSDIYVMNNDGKNIRQLTNTPFWDTSPRWSPDGKQIVFMRDMGPAEEPRKFQQLDIFLMDADGSNEKRLTSHPAIDAAPTWSPDGQHIAFVSSRGKRPEIYVLELANGALTQITQNGDGDAYSSAPSWSPDGQNIVHEQVIAGGGRHIYITDIDGKNTRPFLKGNQPHFVGDTVISKYSPRWSPDGKHVMYYEAHLRFEPAKRLANYLIVVDKNGGNPKKLEIPKNWWIGTACWAGNGTQVLFSALPNGLDKQEQVQPSNKLNIYRYHIPSGKIIPITDTPNHKDSSPDETLQGLSVFPEDKIEARWGEIKKGPLCQE